MAPLANNLNWRAPPSMRPAPAHAWRGGGSQGSRLNDAGVVAASNGQASRAEAAFSQAIELKSRWYVRAADNLAALGAPK